MFRFFGVRRFSAAFLLFRSKVIGTRNKKESKQSDVKPPHSEEGSSAASRN
jgi:hypothetical protein